MLKTPRLLLKPMILADATYLLEMNSDPEVIRYTGDALCKDLQDAQKIVTDLCFPQFEKYKMGRFSVFLHDGTYLGWCGLKNFPEQNQIDLGYRLMKKFWGQGFATEASKASLLYGFETLNLSKIIARSMPANTSSIKIMQKLGMTFRGVGIDPTDPHHFVYYDITSKEFQACNT